MFRISLNDGVADTSTPLICFSAGNPFVITLPGLRRLVYKLFSLVCSWVTKA